MTVHIEDLSCDGDGSFQVERALVRIPDVVHA
jgi:hypothetical protein